MSSVNLTEIKDAKGGQPHPKSHVQKPLPLLDLEGKIIKYIKLIQNRWLLLLFARISCSTYFLKFTTSWAH